MLVSLLKRCVTNYLIIAYKEITYDYNQGYKFILRTDIMFVREGLDLEAKKLNIQRVDIVPLKGCD